jgi:dTMP kinase
MTFIVIEGGEGVGKSTQVGLLADRLGAEGKWVTRTFEPGGSPRGAELRRMLLGGGDPVDERAELFLMLADRADHVAEVIRPALAAGMIVVCDRFTPSTLTYQGAGRGFDIQALTQMSALAADRLEPDVVIVLDLPDAAADARVAAERDRFERAGADFHARVRAAYRELAPTFGWVVVDAAGSAEEVGARVWAVVGPRLSSQT